MNSENAYDDVTDIPDEIVEQAGRDVAVVVSALLQISEYYGLELSENGIGHLAGYLRSCVEYGTPRQLVEALVQFFDEWRKLNRQRVPRYLQQRINGSLN